MPASRPADERPWPVLERVGFAYLKRHLADDPDRPAPLGHILRPDELAALKAVERGVILRAAIAGMLAGVAVAVAELEMVAYLGGEPVSMSEQLTFWTVVAIVGGLSTGLEIAFLYWDSLRSIRRLARIAGIDIRDLDDEGAEALLRALARTAFELPNPVQGHLEVNVLRETSRLRVLAATGVYKLKIGLTSFILKAVIRRGLGRAVVRVWAPFIAVPVTALWNAWVARWVLREARIRAMGPSAAHAFADAIFGPVSLSDAGKLAALRAVAAVVVRTSNLHPNVAALLSAVHARIAFHPDAAIDDSRQFLTELARLPGPEQACALQVLIAAAVIDGDLHRRERALLAHAARACGVQLRVAAVSQLCAEFVAGRAFAPRALAACITRDPQPAGQDLLEPR